jgi:hypothetical protein
MASPYSFSTTVFPQGPPGLTAISLLQFSFQFETNGVEETSGFCALPYPPRRSRGSDKGGLETGPSVA